MSIRTFILFTALVYVLGSCSSDAPSVTKPSIPFQYRPTEDSTIISMIGWEQEGDLQKITPFLKSENPAYRYQALHTFCTPRASQSVATILPMMRDTVKEVRRRAIYAVGQCANKTAIASLRQTYNPWDSLRIFEDENRLVLEAIGKCGARQELEQLASISTFSSADTTLIKGQLSGLFHLLLKGIHSTESIDKAASYFFDGAYPMSIRRMAGYYLVRGRSFDMSAQEFGLGKMLRSNEEYTLRAMAAGIMANTGNAKFSDELVQQLGREKNDQVKINILRALYKMPYAKARSAVFKEVNNKNPQISRMAARFFLLNGQADDAAQYWDKVKKQKLDPIAKANFAAATAKNLPFYYAITRDAAIRYITDELKNNSDPYIRAQLLQVIAELPEQSKIIVDAYTPDAAPVVKSQTAFSIQKALQVATANKKYIKTANSNARKLFDKIIADRDIGALAAMANVVRDTSSSNLFRIFRRQNQLLPLLDSLQLPAEIETYNELVDLLKIYGNTTVEKATADKFVSFDASLFKKLGRQSSAKISTSAGDFTIQLMPYESPISTMNFVSLAESGYFNGKIFHRVVPNFVIQTGCHRGDGYGSSEAMIRSELGEVSYDQPGRVGMASAGNDTESSQWFVTHLPVFHLDGRYTIFGQVEAGLDVVNRINVGDNINSVVISY